MSDERHRLTKTDAREKEMKGKKENNNVSEIYAN